jgi:hypothetical protein
MVNKMKIKFSITLNPVTLRNYKQYCEKEGYKCSTRIEILIKRDMEEKK